MGQRILKTFWKGPWLQTLRPIGPEVARTKWTQHLGLLGQMIKFFTSYANILPLGQYSFTPRTSGFVIALSLQSPFNMIILFEPLYYSGVCYLMLREL